MKGFIIALQFMTRIPLKINIDMTEDEFGSSSKFFPLVGLTIGIILSLAYMLLTNIFPFSVVAALIIVMEIVLTGGIHLDGFLDTMDGILSARERERMLEIMKDSRVGAHSVTALFCLLLLKYSILISLPLKYAPIIILLMPVIGRFMMLFCVAFFPYARKKGLGKIFWLQTKKEYLYFNLVVLIVIFLIILPYKFLALIPLTFILIFLLILKINKILQGHTGDTYGAICEISEVVFILLTLI